MKPIKLKDLEAIAGRINRLRKAPETAHNGKAWNVGHYHLSQAYGGFALHMIANESGGIKDALNVGHVSKRELQALMFAFIAGIYEGEKA